MQDPLLTKINTDTYLCFDFGNKKIGAAVGQTITATASPLQTIRSINQSPDWEIISKLIQEWRPAGLVVGISKQADGSDNPITPRMFKFCRQLKAVINCLFIDRMRHSRHLKPNKCCLMKSVFLPASFGKYRINLPPSLFCSPG